MLYRKLMIVCLPFVILFHSCSTFFSTKMNVISCSIDGNSFAASFSKTPERTTVFDSFTVTMDGDKMEGSYVFEGCLVRFIPDQGILSEHIYYVTITQKIEDNEGVSLEKEFIQIYDLKSNSSAPQILSILPENYSETNSPVNKISISFSEPVDVDSFYSSFSLSPSAGYFTLWNSEHTQAEVYFEHPLDLNIRYTVTISTLLHDASNNCLCSDFTSSFTNVIDLSPPEYTLSYSTSSGETTIGSNAINYEIPRAAKLQLSFSEPISNEGIANLISFKPPLTAKIEIDRKSRRSASISFTDSPAWGSQYELIVAEGIEDDASNRCSKTSSFQLCFNNESDRPVEFISGLMNTGDKTWFTLSSENCYDDLILPAEYFPVSGTTVIPLYLFFRISNESSSLNLKSLLKSISIDSTNACASCIIKTITILSSEEYAASEISAVQYSAQDTSDWNVCTVLCTIEVSNETNCGLLKFYLDDEIADSIGNMLGKNIILPYNKI